MGAAAICGGAFLARPVGGAVLAVLAIGVLVAAHRRRMVIAGIGLVVIASGLSARAWAGLEPPPTRPVSGWVTLRNDPDRRFGGVEAVVDHAGKRYVTWAYGGVGRRLERRSAGEIVWISGSIGALAADDRVRWAPRHVAGELELDTVGDHRPGAPYSRAANRIRGLLVAGTGRWPPLERALFLGLVVGDDREQPDDLIDDFVPPGSPTSPLSPVRTWRS